MQISPRRQKRSYSGAMAAFVFCALLIAGVVHFRSTLSSVAWRVVAPAINLRAAAGDAAKGLGAQVMSKSALMAENEALKAQIASTSAALADRNALYAENQQLKNRFGSTRGVVAGIIARPPATPYDTLEVDAGSRDGVTEGDYVSSGGTLVIGTVTEVHPSTARVTLLSAPGSTYDALLQTMDGKSTPISIEGRGVGSMRGTVPAGVPVAAGDSVSFAGVAGGFIGTVASVEAPDDQSLKTVYLHMPVDFFSLRYVSVLHVVEK